MDCNLGIWKQSECCYENEPHREPYVWSTVKKALLNPNGIFKFPGNSELSELASGGSASLSTTVTSEHQEKHQYWRRSFVLDVMGPQQCWVVTEPLWQWEFLTGSDFFSIPQSVFPVILTCHSSSACPRIKVIHIYAKQVLLHRRKCRFF